MSDLRGRRVRFPKWQAAANVTRGTVVDVAYRQQDETVGFYFLVLRDDGLLDEWRAVHCVLEPGTSHPYRDGFPG